MSAIDTEETYKMLTEMAKDEQPMAILFLSLLKNCNGPMRENLLRQAGEAIYFANEVVRRADDPGFTAELMRQAKDGR